MDSQALLNIVTISISTILSVGAIVISIVFYKESNKQNKETALIQGEIKNAIQKIEKLYDRTYTDTFDALKTQLNAMQKYIFSSTVGDSNISEPNELRFYILGYITQKSDLTIDELCTNIKGFKREEIMEIVYLIHSEGLISFDGKNLKYIKNTENQRIDGQGDH